MELLLSSLFRVSIRYVYSRGNNHYYQRKIPKDLRETDITLMVGGFLISGSVVSAKKYFTHNATVTMAGMIE